MTLTLIPVDHLTVGIDLGDKYSHYCELDTAGAILEEGRLATSPAAFQRRFGRRPPARIAIEAGTHSAWVARLLVECGHDVIVANPRNLRVIYENDRKTDRVDAQQLARVARVDPQLLHPIEHRPLSVQHDLTGLRTRQALVRARTQLVNHVRTAIKPFAVRLPKCSTATFAKRARTVLPTDLASALTGLLHVVEALNSAIRELDQRAERLVRDVYPEVQRLSQVPGVGVITALTYRLTIDDPHRFSRSRAVGSYLGLRPRQRASGAQDRQLRITKAGDSDLRRLLVGCAHYILGPFGPDTDLRRWGLAIAARGGKNAKKRAIVAVARKLAVLLHRLWITDASYEPLRQHAGRG
jgi:transposase